MFSDQIYKCWYSQNNGSRLSIFVILIASFLIKDKNKRICIFEITFLLINLEINITLGIFFLILGNIKINFTN